MEILLMKGTSMMFHNQKFRKLIHDIIKYSIFIRVLLIIQLNLCCGSEANIYPIALSDNGTIAMFSEFDNSLCFLKYNNMPVMSSSIALMIPQLKTRSVGSFIGKSEDFILACIQNQEKGLNNVVSIMECKNSKITTTISSTLPSFLWFDKIHKTGENSYTLSHYDLNSVYLIGIDTKKVTTKDVRIIIGKSRKISECRPMIVDSELLFIAKPENDPKRTIVCKISSIEPFDIVFESSFDIPYDKVISVSCHDNRIVVLFCNVRPNNNNLYVTFMERNINNNNSLSYRSPIVFKFSSYDINDNILSMLKKTSVFNLSSNFWIYLSDNSRLSPFPIAYNLSNGMLFPLGYEPGCKISSDDCLSLFNIKSNNGSHLIASTIDCGTANIASIHYYYSKLLPEKVTSTAISEARHQIIKYPEDPKDLQSDK